MSFEEAGLFYLKALIQDSLGKWLDVTEKEFAHSKAGHRISKNADLNAAADNLLKSERITSVIGEGWQCVRAIAFNKSPQSNWSLGWHQDRTEACGITQCEAKAGDVWLYSTPILHASARASVASSRRVLHLDFSKDQLPPPLKWHRID